MARPLRIERAGGWYHVTARGNEKRSIYRDNRDRLHFIELLAETVGRFHLRLHGFVLMDNHYHLIVELNEANLSRAGQWLNVSYSVWFNRRHKRSGHLFQGRFKSVVVNPAEWGLELSRYLHLNPVRIGRMGLGKAERQGMRAGAISPPEAEVVKERIRFLRQFRWSSYRAYVGLETRPAWLECESVLELGGGKQCEQRRRYCEYVEVAVREGVETNPWQHLKEQVVLGGGEFLEKLRQYVKGDAREQRGVVRLAVVRPTLKEAIASVEKIKGESWKEFRDRHGDSGRDLVLYLGQRVCGLKLRELASATGLTNYSSVSIAVRRFEKRLRGSKAERDRVQRIRQLLNV